MRTAAVLFDLDGTLVDSLPDLTTAVNHMLAELGRPTLRPDQVRLLVGKGARNLVQRALGSEQEDEIIRGLTLFTDYNSRHIADSSQLYPGIKSVLDTLAGMNIRMAVVSNKPEGLSRLVMKTLGVEQYFGTIAGGDTFPEMKPSPLPLLRTMAGLGVLPEETVMVGDSINDIQAGISAGITTIGCDWGYGQPGELEQAHHIASSGNQLTNLLLGQGADQP